MSYSIATITVGLRDDMDAYYQEHERIPSRAWVLSRIILDPKTGKPAYTEDEVRSLPLADVEDIWQEFQGELNARPTKSQEGASSSTG